MTQTRNYHQGSPILSTIPWRPNRRPPCFPMLEGGTGLKRIHWSRTRFDRCQRRRRSGSTQCLVCRYRTCWRWPHEHERASWLQRWRGNYFLGKNGASGRCLSHWWWIPFAKNLEIGRRLLQRGTCLRRRLDCR